MDRLSIIAASGVLLALVAGKSFAMNQEDTLNADGEGLLDNSAAEFMDVHPTDPETTLEFLPHKLAEAGRPITDSKPLAKALHFAILEQAAKRELSWSQGNSWCPNSLKAHCAQIFKSIADCSFVPGHPRIWNAQYDMLKANPICQEEVCKESIKAFKQTKENRLDFLTKFQSTYSAEKKKAFSQATQKIPPELAATNYDGGDSQ